MGTKWIVEGDRPKVKIIAECAKCHTQEIFLDDSDPIDPIEGHKRVIASLFRHNGCNGLVEKIPQHIQNKYWDRAVVPGY